MRIVAIVASALVPCSALLAETAQERLREATEVFQEIMATPDKGIPQELLDRSHCAVIIPNMKKAALGIGGQYGRGFAICRQSTGRGWGAPASVRMEGGSFGFQIGASNTDLVMLVMNERGMKKLLESKFTLGADASAVAGPVGRSTSAQTDAQMSAEILAWSRSQGVFAGVALSGATLRNDLDENKELYGREVHNREVLMTGMKPPAAAQPLIAALTRYSKREQGGSADRGVVERRAEKAADKVEDAGEATAKGVKKAGRTAADKTADAAEATAGAVKRGAKKTKETVTGEEKKP